MKALKSLFKKRKEYNAIEEKSEKWLPILHSDTTHEVWNKVKNDIILLDIPIKIEEKNEFETWDGIYVMIRNLEKEKWDKNMKAYMTICELLNKMLTFTQPPSDLFFRIHDIFAFLLKHFNIDTKNKKIEKCTVLINIEDNELTCNINSGLLNWSYLNKYIEIYKTKFTCVVINSKNNIIGIANLKSIHIENNDVKLCFKTYKI